MEKKLKILFDFQRFEHNERLEKLIHETEGRCTRKLSDEELGMVNAAGELETGTNSGGTTGNPFGPTNS